MPKATKPSVLRRKEVEERARADVYGQKLPRPLEERINPFEGKMAEQYARRYNSLRRIWLQCEYLLDILGGRPQISGASF